MKFWGYEMNRELKFRIFDLYNKNFIQNKEFSISYDGIPLFSFSQSSRNSCLINKCDLNKNFIISQFTGLKDCYGKDIYEGDLIEYEDFWSKEKTIDEVTIEADESSMECHPFNSYSMDEMCMKPPKKCKIIGNIFENPELLEMK